LTVTKIIYVRVIPLHFQAGHIKCVSVGPRGFAFKVKELELEYELEQ